MIAERLLLKILKEGVNLSPEKHKEVVEDIRDARKGRRIHVLKRNGNKIGFFTWHEQPTGIYVNNLIVFRDYRNPNNLLHLRKVFRDRFNMPFSWENLKREKDFYSI